MLRVSSSVSPASSAINGLFSNRTSELLDCRGVSEEEREDFAALLSRANGSNAATNPKAFLNSLSADEMELLRKVHSLANPIAVNNLDFEGAYNLLTAPGESKDLNNDGLLSIGAGKIWQYPPPNAPEAVKKAWDEATANLPESERFLAMAPFLAATASANVKPDLSGFYEPGEPGYRNIYADPAFSYTKQVQDILAMMERFKGQSDMNYQQNKEFLESFLSALQENQVA